jgi:hypothetical protein
VLSADIDQTAVAILAEPATPVEPANTRRVITLIVDIMDGSGNLHAVDSACDGPDQLSADLMFGSQTGRLNADGCYQDGSYGVFGFGGTTYPGTALDVMRVTVSEVSPSLTGICPYYQWAAAADAAAQAQGANLGAYQHRMYVLPADTVGCAAWAGLAYLGCGDSCQAWVRAYSYLPCGYPDAIAHELGHKVGLHHARTDANNDGVYDCEYCDMSDTMGYATGYWRTFNAPHKDWMGWLPAARIVDGSAGGTFTISALEMTNPAYAQVIKVIPASGSPYWLSYRAAIGYDANLPASYGYFNKLQVHRADQWISYLITQLDDGNAFVDQGLGLTVTQVSHSADSATVRVRFGSSCVKQAPSVSFAPGVQYANASQLPATRSYTFELTNMDDVDCDPRTWPLATTLPAGWSASLSNAAPTAPPGSTVEVAVDVTAPASTPQGTYPVRLTVAGDEDHPSIEQSAAFVVDTTAPTVAITTPASGKKYLLNSKIYAAYSCADALSPIQSCVGSLAQGSRVPTATTGTKSFVVTATDAAGNVRQKTASYTVISAYSLSPTSLVFADQALNLTSTAKSITLRNTANAAIPITAIAIAGTNLRQFAQTNNCPKELPISASCTIKVTFRPTGTGVKSARVSVTAGETELKRVALSGTGVRSVYSVSPTALTFGNVASNTTSIGRTITITNTGTVVLPITTIAVGGFSAGQFAQTNNCPARLPVGRICKATVVFKPTSRGNKTAYLRITPGGGASAKSVPLTGTGI